MTTARIHLRIRIDPGRGPVALCRWWGGPSLRYVTDESAVTCRTCLAGIAAPAEPTYAERLEAGVGHVESGMGVRVALRLPERRDDDAVRQWPSWRFALRALVASRDDGARLRSTWREPSQRLDGGNTGFAPEGDSAQREVERLAPVARALDSAYRAPFVVCDTPRREVPAWMCHEILIAVVTGRRVDGCDLEYKHAASPGEKLRRGKISRRFPIGRRLVGESANAREDEGRTKRTSDIEEYVCKPATERLGFDVTPGHVVSIVRLGGIAIEASLASGKWLAQSDESLHRAGLGAEGESMADRTRNVRIGWEAIAEYLGRSVDWAQRAEGWDPPLPVRRLSNNTANAKPTVEADSEELDAWVRDVAARGKKASGA